ncbi:hypothetical protein A2U01_0042839, partial [Trifolium medium]|nr:hypothetical protein [Trifolium medium]
MSATDPRDNILIGQYSSPKCETGNIMFIRDGEKGLVLKMRKVRKTLRKQAEVR